MDLKNKSKSLSMSSEAFVSLATLIISLNYKVSLSGAMVGIREGFLEEATSRLGAKG